MLREAFLLCRQDEIQLISKAKVFVVLPPAFCILHVPFSLSSIFQSQCSLVVAGEMAYPLNLGNKFCLIELVVAEGKDYLKP